MRIVWRFALTTVVAWFLAPALLLAQQDGTIRGAVVDQGGEVVAGATVVLRNFGEAEGREILTSVDGRYLSGGLEPGIYTARALKGDLGSQMFRVRVRDGHSVEVNFVLEPGRRVAAWLTEAGERESFTRAFAAGLDRNRAGQFDDAIEAFQRALALDPSCLECNYNLAITFVEVGRLDDAEASFRRALEIRPDYAAAYYGLSNVYARQDRTVEAAEARSQANRLALERLAYGRAQAEDAVARGIVFLDAGNVADAIGRFETAVARDSNFAPARYWLGVSLLEMGQNDRARAELERYLQQEPTGEYADDARVRLSESLRE